MGGGVRLWIAGAWKRDLGRRTAGIGLHAWQGYGGATPICTLNNAYRSADQIVIRKKPGVRSPIVLSGGYTMSTNVEERSFRISAVLLNTANGDVPQPFVKFRPSGRAEDKAEALIKAYEEVTIGDPPVLEADLEHILADLGNDVHLYLALIASGSRCQTCGALRDHPTEWCDDKNGCATWRLEPVKEKGPSASERDMMAKMQRLVQKNGK